MVKKTERNIMTALKEMCDKVGNMEGLYGREFIDITKLTEEIMEVLNNHTLCSADIKKRIESITYNIPKSASVKATHEALIRIKDATMYRNALENAEVGELSNNIQMMAYTGFLSYLERSIIQGREDNAKELKRLIVEVATRLKKEFEETTKSSCIKQLADLIKILQKNEDIFDTSDGETITIADCVMHLIEAEF